MYKALIEIYWITLLYFTYNCIFKFLNFMA